MRDRLSDAMQGAVGSALGGLDSALASLLASWTSAQRLYSLEGEGPLGDLMVERFSLVDSISEPYRLQLHTLCLHNRVRLQELLGQRATLCTVLADGSQHRRSGLVFEAREGGADGGLVRHHLVVQPWIALLGHTRASRVWQDKSIVQILDDVLGGEAYGAHAAWQWGETDAEGNTEDLGAFLARGPNGGVRSYCVQYRESDLSFLQRLLAEEGLGWRVEEADEAPSGHRVVFFADSARWPENSSSRSSLGGAGLRFHRASAAEQQDAIQSFGGWRQLSPAATAVLQWDYQTKQAIAAEAPSAYDFTSDTLRGMAPWLQQYEPAGATADTAIGTGPCTTAELQHRAVCHQQAHEARHKTWIARSTVRSLRAGEHFGLTQSTLDELSAWQTDADRQFSVCTVHALGVNNLPKELSARLMQTPATDPFAELDDTPADALVTSLEHDPELSEQAAKLGYANRFEALRRLIPWRPTPPTAPTALGAQTAIVVGPDGNTNAQGADELHTDALGRIRVQFHWQAAPGADARADNRSTCWVRVAQRWAGAGMGCQHIPRIGQEVLLDFIEGDIERPIVLGSLYNGRGEAGLPPTPGGAQAEIDTSAYKTSQDHRPSAQGNLVQSGPGGNSPAWHGGAPGPASKDAAAQNNAAALSGIKSKEFGGEGFNQLVFDDTPEQLRVQLATTQHATQLNLGHLIHQADNHRGHYRGLGFELRTDAYGAVRATQGLLITSFGARDSDPAGDNAAGMALLKQAAALADSFSQAAKTHQTTALATAIGTIKANQSTLSDKLAPMKALHQSASGMVSAASLDEALADASKKATQATSGAVPHSTDPIVAITAKAGLATVAGQDIQLASGEAISWQAGQDLQLASGQQMRVHTGQSIGVLAGAIQAGQGAKGTGLTMIAGKGPVQMQAQAAQAEVAAKNLVNVQSANAHIDWAAAKKITLTTSGGAQIVIVGEGITVQCPGKITVRAAQKSFVGGGSESYGMPSLPVFNVTAEPSRELKSTFALDQLTNVAKNITQAEFLAFMVPIFGTEINAVTYFKLHTALRNGALANPPIQVVEGAVRGHLAAFDQDKRIIYVASSLCDAATRNRQGAWELLAALLEEFGHYIDVVLRNDLSEVGGDAKDDEGALYAYRIAQIDFRGTSETSFADYTSPKYKGPLKVRYAEFHSVLNQLITPEAIANDEKEGPLEFFEAGRGKSHQKNPLGSFGHRSLESVLGRLFSPDELAQIYFGNWLRDFSQMVDPAITRKSSDPRNFPKSISREEITNLVNLKAEIEFEITPENKHLYRVTPKVLGVYRPVEHIDNPKNLDNQKRDPREIDPDFAPLVNAGDSLLQVDPKTSMKTYIGKSADYMAEQLRLAVSAGRTPEGMRHFGAALHVLEDYFAHSNFVELSLRKVGHTKVQPWTSVPAGHNRLPVVTGMFDQEDVLASTAGVIAELLVPVKLEFKETKSGERTTSDRAMLILLREHSDPFYLQAYQNFLKARDVWAQIPGHQYIEGAMHYTLGMVANAQNFVINNLIQLIGNSVDDYQTTEKGDPNTNGSTDPSHSQLAKDHDNHPFHTLAAELAQMAVQRVGQVMIDAWRGISGADPSLGSRQFIAHPFDVTWMDQKVTAWARANPVALKRGESSTEWEHLRKEHEKEVMEALERARKIIASTQPQQGETTAKAAGRSGTAAAERTWNYIKQNYSTINGDPYRMNR